MVKRLKKKRVKGTKKCVIKRELKFKHYEDCNKANQLNNTVKCLEKNGVNTYVLKENYEEFIANNQLMLKTQQRFKSERHNGFYCRN